MPAADTPPSGSRRARARSELERARECFARRAWGEAFERLERADERGGLEREDLERLATAAYLTGRDDDYLKALERAHRAHAAAGEPARAARSAFWLGLRLMFRGDGAQARGWFARAQRLVDSCGSEQLEHGYLLVPVVEQRLAADELDAAHDTAQRAIDIGERFGDADLVAIARYQQGRVCLLQGRTERGLSLFDETMVSVIAGELSPIVTGLVYCGVIDGCRLVYAFDRSREWTAALARWCDEQPEMVAFTGVCQVHRSEILQLHGAWPDAAQAAQRASERCRGINEAAASEASYQQGEVHRLRGEFAAAEQAYREASRSGMDPQPGLALLRLAQGRTEAAASAIRRAVDAARERWTRTRLLPAYVEIMLAAGDRQAARGASGELARMAAALDAPVLGALAGHARGSVELADGDPRAALGSLRHAWTVWRKVDAPYPAARARELLGLCCRALDDEDGARLELDAARIAFAQLGAAPDLARVEALLRGPRVPERPCGLTARELQVLKLIAAGKTNKAIAAELLLSEKTVERHVSNMFGKLDVSSRAAATAYAYEHGLL